MAESLGSVVHAPATETSLDSNKDRMGVIRCGLLAEGRASARFFAASSAFAFALASSAFALHYSVQYLCIRLAGAGGGEVEV